MRIVFVSHTGEVGGAEQILLSIMGQLSMCELTLLSPVGSLPDHASQLGVSCSPFENLIRALPRIRRCVRNAVPDLIHAGSLRAGIVAAIATVGMPVRVLWHIHGGMPAGPAGLAVRLFFLVSRRISAVCASNATSHCFRGRLLTHLTARRRIHVLHNGIDPARFHPATHTDREVDARSLRDCLGLPAKAFVVGTTGHMTERKGYLELIRAFPAILARVPSAVLLIAANPVSRKDWEYRARMDDAIRELALNDRVYLTGYRENMTAVFRGISVLVANTQREPLGLAVLEAMACGMPVIAANVGGAAEIIRNGRNGFLYEPGDYPQLVEYLAGLAESTQLATPIRASARETVAGLFTTDVHISQLTGIYRRTLAPHSFPTLFHEPARTTSGRQSVFHRRKP
jgi:glycosyltransferase involved in cell wall biosynthesis